MSASPAKTVSAGTATSSAASPSPTSPMKVSRKKATPSSPTPVNSAATASPAATEESKENGVAAERPPPTAEQIARREARLAANAARPCFDLAEGGSCARGAACRFSHDPAILATAAQAKKDREEAQKQRAAKIAAQKSERAAKKSAATTAAPVINGDGTAVKVKQPPVLATRPDQASSAPDLTHTLVHKHISAKHPNISAKIAEVLKNKPFIIGVTGGTASGKTTVCDEIVEKLGHRVRLLQMDRFYKSLPHGKNPAKHNFDVPEAFDWPLFIETLTNLATGMTVQVPQYSFVTHQRLPEKDTFEGSDVLLVEGLFTLYEPKIRNQFDLKVFIEADADIRLGRRIKRDISERGRTVDSVIAQYNSTVKPAHEQFIQPTARYADIIVPHNGEKKNDIAIELLVQHISTEIYKRGANLHGKVNAASKSKNIKKKVVKAEKAQAAKEAAKPPSTATPSLASPTKN